MKIEKEKRERIELQTFTCRNYKIPWNENSYYYLHHKDFVTPSTIPDYFIPKPKVLDIMRNDINKVHTPKTHNHYRMRDFLHNDWWNDVSL